MQSMLSAEATILIHFESVRVIFLVLHSIVVSLLAFTAHHCNFYSQVGTSQLFLSFRRQSTRRHRIPPMQLIDFTSLRRSCSAGKAHLTHPGTHNFTRKKTSPLRRGITSLPQLARFVNRFFEILSVFSLFVRIIYLLGDFSAVLTRKRRKV